MVKLDEKNLRFYGTFKSHFQFESYLDNNVLKNSLPGQRVIEEHILKSDNPYVQKAAKYVSDAFSLRESHVGSVRLALPFSNKILLFPCNLLYPLTYLSVLRNQSFRAVTSHLLSKYSFSFTP